MTLQTSPPLSLSQIKTEFVGGNSLSGYYAGGLYVPSGTSGVNGAVPSSGSMAMSKFLGTSDYLEKIALTIGSSGGPFPLYGYASTFGFGSISPTTFTPTGGQQIDILYWNDSDGRFWFAFEQDGVPNSGWTTLTVNGNAFNRADATYSSGGGETSWVWGPSVANPLGTSGSVDVTFT